MCNNSLLDWLEGCLERVPTRFILGIMAFLGLMSTQMIRANLYISIVGMVGERLINDTHAYNISQTNVTIEDGPKTVLDANKLDWDEATQGMLFSAFYWCYWVTELPGGIMAQRWGGRRVLGISVSIAAVVNALIPIASRFHVGLVAALRAIQGLALGVTWPAVHALAGCWIPVAERSKFMSAYHGAAVGNALIYPLCGFLMEKLGWESTFYMTAGINVLWAMGCWLFIYDTPAEHPRITTKERKYLRRQLLAKTKAEKNCYKTPWIKICTSSACWAVFAASQGMMWCTITLTMQLPSYFQKVLNLDLKMNGLMSGLPELSKFGFGLIFSAVMDSLLQRNAMSLTSVRKFAVAASEYIPAALLLVFSFTDVSKNTIMAVTLLVLASAFGGASSSGSLANIVDISPNFAGVILGLIKTLSLIPGILSPLIVGILTGPSGIESGWERVFFIAALIHIVCCTFFLIYGTAEVQPWNDEETNFVVECYQKCTEEEKKETEAVEDVNFKADIPLKNVEEGKKEFNAISEVGHEIDNILNYFEDGGTNITEDICLKLKAPLQSIKEENEELQPIEEDEKQ